MGLSLRGLDVDRHSKHGTWTISPCLKLCQRQVGAQTLGMPRHYQLRFATHRATHYDRQHGIWLREGWLARGSLGHWPISCILKFLQPQRVRQGGHHFATTTAATAGGCPPAGGPPGLQVLVFWGAEAAAVILEVFVAGKALGAASTAELVVACVGTLVLSEVGAAAEGLAAQGTLVELHAWWGEKVSERHPDPLPCNSAPALEMKPSLLACLQAST